MAMEFSCKMAGSDCPFAIVDENADELVSIVQKHGRDMHNEDVSREDILRMARKT